MISIIIPIYNEKNGILPTINELYNTLQTLKDPYEVILVDDGSNDGTRELIDNFSKPNLIKIGHRINLGYGAALKTGIEQAQGDIIVITDADGTYPNMCIPDLVKTYHDGKHDMVVGARTKNKASIPLIRRPAKWFITWLASYLTGIKIPDLNSGLRVMNKKVVQKYQKLLPNGFSFTSTITLIMLSNGFSVKYIPIDYFKREGKSKIRPIQDTLLFLQLIVRTIMYFNPLKVFIPLSLILFLLSFLVIFFSWIFLDQIMDVTFGIIAMTAINVLTIGMIADLIDKRME